MNILRNILACVIGLVIGSAVNLTLVNVGPLIIPPPTGVDVSDMDSLKSTMHLFEPRHFIFPFLAHSLGTLAGAVTAFLIAASHREMLANIIGTAFFAGGIAASYMLPAPTWYIVVDLVGAYFPMAWIGSRLARRFVPGPGSDNG